MRERSAKIEIASEQTASDTAKALRNPNNSKLPKTVATFDADPAAKQ